MSFFHRCSFQATVLGGLLTLSLATPSLAAGKLVFISSRNGQQDLYTMSSDGSNQTALTTSPGSSEGNPAWSPDGSKLHLASMTAFG